MCTMYYFKGNDEVSLSQFIDDNSEIVVIYICNVVHANLLS